jgi:hypothetical protein
LQLTKQPSGAGTSSSFVANATETLKVLATKYVNETLIVKEAEPEKKETKKLSDREKWRSRARSYKKPDPGTLSSPTVVSKTSDTTAIIRLRLWSSLVLLKNICGGCAEAQNQLVSLEFQTILSNLLRTLICASVPSKTQANLNKSSSSSSSSSWIPSESYISSALLATYASFAQQNFNSKHFIVHSGESKIQFDKNGKSNYSLLHQLISLGLTHSTPKSFRRLALTILASLVRETAFPSDRKGSESISLTAQFSGIHSLYSYIFLLHR